MLKFIFNKGGSFDEEMICVILLITFVSLDGLTLVVKLLTK